MTTCHICHATDGWHMDCPARLPEAGDRPGQAEPSQHVGDSLQPVVCLSRILAQCENLQALAAEKGRGPR